MYLRWQSRKRRTAAYGKGRGDVHWAAIIVENVRTGGKPTQRHIAYLGGITESAIAIMHQRCWFWDEITEKLGSLKLATDDRRQIEEAVAQKVPRPTKVEYEQAKRDRARSLKE